jgi:murein DD-endopeptidase MepM/ murein hydrolase activator NlpD
MIVGVALIAVVSGIPIQSANAQKSISELNQEIEGRKEDINALKSQILGYQQKIKAQQKQSSTLQGQLAILENQIAKVQLDIEATEIQIEQTSLEIQQLNLEIQAKELGIKEHKKKLSEYVRLLDQQDDVSYLEVLLTNNSFSEFFDYLQSIEQIQDTIHSAVESLKQDKQRLEVDKANVELKKHEEEEFKNTLLVQKAELDERKQGQQVLLVQNTLNERQYKNQLYNLQLEQQQINADIAGLEKKMRDELAKRQGTDKLKEFGPARLRWPLDPGRGITTYFHDPGYPFRYVYEHPGLDIRAYQGTPIEAPESGYVGKVKFVGDTSYAYIMLIHNDGLSTVFGHVSRVDVKEEQFVTKGQIIGASGGKPGGTGSGKMTTGPHLHFEVRLDGIPVDPLGYLPAL